MFEITNLYELTKNLIPNHNHKKMRANNDFLILTTKNLTIFYLNETAKDFYELIDGKKTFEQVIVELKLIYQIEFNIIINDIINLVRDLQWKNLIYFKEFKNETI